MNNSKFFLMFTEHDISVSVY